MRAPRLGAVGLVGLVGIAGCPRELPSHLLDRPTEVARPADWSTPDAAVRTLLDGDPFARRPRLPDDPAVWDALGWPAVGAALAELPVASTHPDRLGAADDGASGLTAAVWAGARLRQVELAVGEGALSVDHPRHAELAAWLTGLPTDTAPIPGPRSPLAWLQPSTGGERAQLLADAVRAYAERAVLVAWLTPGAPLGPVAEALAAPTFDGPRETAWGRLLTGRASGAAADRTDGLVDLGVASAVWLERVAADRDSEQSAHARRLASLRTELGLAADADPVVVLLQRASERLTAAAGDDAAVGGGVLALSALRLTGRCDQPPCDGVDRVRAITDAGRWSPALDPWIAMWQVAALKGALDAVEVGHDRVTFAWDVVDLVDALVGTSPRPSLDLATLTRGSPDARVWHELGLAVGVDAATSWEQVRAGLMGELVRRATAAAARVDPTTAQVLERIARRAEAAASPP